MVISFLRLKSWRNFREAELSLAQRSYLVGPNASGKSNLLDVFRFLRDLCKISGGGLQKAVLDRGGITKLRCLHARRDTEVQIEVHLKNSLVDVKPAWRYILGFKSEGKGAQRLLVSAEEVWDGEKQILLRPNAEDKKDDQLLTQTHIEQIQANAAFRKIADSFTRVTYLHLVPQLLKYGDKIGGQRLEDDPFGQGFLERIAKCTAKTREARLRKIAKALSFAIPQFHDPCFTRDDVTGRPHLEGLYHHHRPNAGWQREQHFSDGTLRLIALLWSLLEGNSFLLIEEPELSLHEEVVAQIPLLIDRVLRQTKHRRQVIISTHSNRMLDNPGIDGRDIIIVEPGSEGSKTRLINDIERKGLEAGFSVSEIVMPNTRPSRVEQLELWDR